ncbi:MAG: hypothetical protein U9R37_02960 [Campylobacterota bacterium]|nr:hypothetical protein [Campylobacterota bacterium]
MKFLMLLCFPLLVFSQMLQIQNGENNYTNEFDSIDMIKTFQGIKDIEISVFDDVSKKVATFPFQSEKNILDLYAIENGVKYTIKSKKNRSINIVEKTISEVCLKYKDDKNYNFIEDSGTNKAATIDDKESIALSSRYISNQKRKKYTDTKTVLIYPKQKKVSTMKYKYGPGNPRVLLQFSKEYEGKNFYIYDYFTQKCYQGIFPSPKIPPFRDLREIR